MTSSSAASLRYEGCADFRARLVSATLSGKAVRISNIRTQLHESIADDASTGIGLQDFEACFLRLLDSLSDGCLIEVNESGTKLFYKPGILIGGKITHDCGTSRAMGWFIEGVLPLLPFCKGPTSLTLTGITNNALDLSVDTIQKVTLPLLKHFGVEGTSLTVKRRGAAPKGGGSAELYCPIVRSLRPAFLVNSGKVRRVRGVVFCTRISPTVITRVIDAAKEVLRHVITDVFISSDHYKGAEGGLSAGYSIMLTAESTTGATLCVERSAVATSSGGGGELPETIGQQAALMLLEEMCLGGAVDREHQALALHLCALCPEDVCKVRVGRELANTAVSMLRIARDAYGVTFKVKTALANDVADEEEAEGEDNADGEDDEDPRASAIGARVGLSARKVTNEEGTIELSCLGSGFVNMSRKIK